MNPRTTKDETLNLAPLAMLGYPCMMRTKNIPSTYKNLYHEGWDLASETIVEQIPANEERSLPECTIEKPVGIMTAPEEDKWTDNAYFFGRAERAHSGWPDMIIKAGTGVPTNI